MLNFLELLLWLVWSAENERFVFWINQRFNNAELTILNNKVWDKTESTVAWLVEWVKSIMIMSSLLKADFCQIYVLLARIRRTKWISKHCSKIFVKECHVLCVLPYTRIQNISNVHTVSASSAWSSSTEQAVAETQGDAGNAKLSTKCWKVPIWKIYRPVFTCTVWFMCWPWKNFKTVKYCEEIATWKAPRNLIVSSVAYFTAKNASLDTT